MFDRSRLFQSTRSLALTVSLLTLLSAIGATSAFASGSSRGGVSSGPSAPAPTDPFLLTHAVKAVVVGVDLEQNTFTVRDLKSEELHELQFSQELVLKARKKKDFGGRRKLEPADIAAGQLVKLTVRDADGAVLQLRVEALTET